MLACSFRLLCIEWLTRAISFLSVFSLSVFSINQYLVGLRFVDEEKLDFGYLHLHFRKVVLGVLHRPEIALYSRILLAHLTPER